MLRGLAELGLKRLSEKQTQTSVTFRELEDALRFMGHKFDPHVIKQADHYRLLQQTKTGEDLAATFSPRDLRLGILSIECVIAFDQMEDGGQKLARRRSLIY
jgi:hypothetical protein